MQKICAAFAVGKDIVQKLRSLSAQERKEFILGRIDSDYFGKHFVTIEELDDHWERMLSYLGEKRGLAILNHGIDLEDPDRSNLLMLVEESYIRKIIESLDRWKPMDIANDYNEFIERYDLAGEDVSFYRFVDFIDAIREVAGKAMEIKGTILFSLEYWENAEKYINSKNG